MAKNEIPYKIYLNENEMPRYWYNLRADMKNKPAPLLNPGTGKPMTAEELGAVFCEDLVKQELDNDTREYPVPQEILDFYKMYRPSPLVRAYCLEKKLNTPAKIYYKFEGNNTSGSHKLNSAIAQAYYAKKQGLKGVTTETGAGQWGTALSMACAYFELDCKVYMVKVSYEQKPFRREVMRVYGADVTPSPSMTTQVGQKILREHPGTTGSLGCAISEAVETAVGTPGVRHQTGYYHRLRRGRKQPGRPDRPLHGPEAAGRGGLPVHRGGACLLSQPDPGRVRLRLLRHGHGVPPGENVYPGIRLHPGAEPRGGPAVPRHEPHPLPAV